LITLFARCYLIISKFCVAFSAFGTGEDPTTIHRVKWRHISVVAIRPPFCGATPSYCA